MKNCCVLKMLMVLSLSIGVSQVYGYMEGTCYPKQTVDAYNGLFFSYTHESMGVAPANWRVPVFKYKVASKAELSYKTSNPNTILGHLVIEDWYTSKNVPKALELVAETTYGRAKNVYFYKNNDIPERLVMYGDDSSGPEGERDWGFNLYKNMEGYVTYQGIVLNVKCKESEDLKDAYRPDSEGKFSLSLDIKKDYPLPKYKRQIFPRQGGFCRNKQVYPNFWLKWEYKNGITVITMHQEESDPERYILERPMEIAFKVITKYPSYYGGHLKYERTGFLYGFITSIHFGGKGFGRMGFMAYSGNDEFYDSYIKPFLSQLEEFGGLKVREGAFYFIPMQSIEAALTQTWGFEIPEGSDSDLGDDVSLIKVKSFKLTCIPELPIPWSYGGNENAD